MACFPQKLQEYLECWDTSIFLIIFLREAPYLVPYFPTIPTFLVRFAILDSYVYNSRLNIEVSNDKIQKVLYNVGE